MPQTTILLPVMALMGWTFLILLLILWRRVRAGLAGEVRVSDFHCGESENVPDHVRLANRNYMNLLELPVIFYALAIILYVSGNVDGTCVVLGWVYVALRIAHSVISLTWNNVLHRLAAFAASNFCVLGLWLKLLAAIAF